MSELQLLVLALIQGLTEFLPISSSAHLILMPHVFGWQDQGLAFDVAVHVGTLGAVVLYFRREIISLSRDWALSLRARATVGESRVAWGVLFGTIPVGLGGLLLHLVGTDALRSPLVIAAATIGFGLLLWWADARGAQRRDEHGLAWSDVLLIGLAQALALIPGTSRSGVTMTAALALGLTRRASARFSFLLSIPVIALAGLLEFYRALTGGVEADWNALALGVVVSGASAYLCIHLFLAFVQRVGMVPFVIYRLLLGVVLLAVFL